MRSERSERAPGSELKQFFGLSAVGAVALKSQRAQFEKKGPRSVSL